MTDSHFTKDLPKGQLGEQIIADLFEKKYAYKTLSFNHNNKHDFKCLIKNKEKTIEVKSDKYCFPDRELKMPFGVVKIKGRDSGNIFIETECRGKLSGISTTISDYYVYYYVYLKKAWIIETKKLKALISNNKFEIKDENVGDEGSQTKGYVIPRNKFKDNFKVIDIDYEWPY
jgi:hypothetical protein